MTKSVPAAAALVMIALGACAGTSASEQACAEELRSAPVVDSVLLDIEQMVEGIVDDVGAEPHWERFQSIQSSCEVPTSLPDYAVPPEEFRVESAPKPVALVNMHGIAGVVFAYGSRGVEETMTGFAAALVEYRPDGTPGRVYKATEILADEGWGRYTTSELTPEGFRRCSLELEYFIYSGSDVVGELDTPIRTPQFCEDVIALPEPH